MQRNFSEGITCEMHSSLEGLQQGCLSCGSLMLVFASGAGTLLILSVRICMGKEFLLLSQCFSLFVFFFFLYLLVKFGSVFLSCSLPLSALLKETQRNK